MKLKIAVWNSPINLRHGSYLLSRLLRQWWQAKQSSVACQCWPPCATWPAYHMNNIIRSKYAFVLYTQWVKNWKKIWCTLATLWKIFKNILFLLACSIVLSVFENWASWPHMTLILSKDFKNWILRTFCPFKKCFIS